MAVFGDGGGQRCWSPITVSAYSQRRHTIFWNCVFPARLAPDYLNPPSWIFVCFSSSSSLSLHLSSSPSLPGPSLWDSEAGQVVNARSESGSVRATGHRLHFMSSWTGYHSVVGHLWELVCKANTPPPLSKAGIDLSIMRMMEEDLTAHQADRMERRQ